MIEVIVGPDREKSWTIHKRLLTTYSRFFHDALRSISRGAHDNIVTLPEDDPDTFTLFIQWLYSGLFTGLPDEIRIKFAKAWILGNKLGAPAFRNNVLDTLLVEPGEGCVVPSTVRYVYAHTDDGSALRRFFADEVLWDAKRTRKAVCDGEGDWSALLKDGGAFASDLFFIFSEFTYDRSNPTHHDPPRSCRAGSFRDWK